MLERLQIRQLFLLAVTMAFSFVLPVESPREVVEAYRGKPIKVWTGVASWYGPGFHGRTTASGQPYDMYASTAAHPWLPFGSLVRVVNLETGQSELARINDRGPYVGKRELDVSYRLARRLSLVEPGTASVRIELLEQPRRRTSIQPSLVN
jgi:rare lipoprotein A